MVRNGFAQGRCGPALDEPQADPNLDDSNDDIPPLEDICDLDQIPDLVSDPEKDSEEQNSMGGNPGDWESVMPKTWAQRVEDEEKEVDPRSLLPDVVPDRTVSCFCGAVAS